MALLGEAGEFRTLKVKAKRLVCGEIEEEVNELDLNREQFGCTKNIHIGVK